MELYFVYSRKPARLRTYSGSPGLSPLLVGLLIKLEVVTREGDPENAVCERLTPYSKNNPPFSKITPTNRRAAEHDGSRVFETVVAQLDNITQYQIQYNT